MRSTRVTLCLIAFAFFLYVTQGAVVTFTNNCPYTVWPGTLTGSGKPQLASTGFTLESGKSKFIPLPSPWSGRFWGRTGCSFNNNGKFICATADCATGEIACNGTGAIPPASLVEITVASDGGQDFYDVSHVDGYNVPMSVTPQGSGISGSCKTVSCRNDINKVCPSALQVVNSNDVVVACKSACMAFNKPEYCCTENYNTPEKCPATDFSKIFKDQCPDAYSYAYDDKTSTFTCSGHPSYLITFCPV